MAPTSSVPNGPDGPNRHGDMRDYMGPNLFQPHRARQAIRDAHEKKIPPLIGYYAGLASVPITRWLAPMGFDYVWIDWEHSAMNIETMTTVCPTCVSTCACVWACAWVWSLVMASSQTCC